MALDSLIVDARVDPAGIPTGLAEAERVLLESVQRIGAIGATLSIDVKVNGLAAATADLQSLRTTTLPPLTLDIAVNEAQAVTAVRDLAATRLPTVPLDIAVQSGQATAAIRALEATTIPPLTIPVEVNGAQAAAAIRAVGGTTIPPVTVQVAVDAVQASAALKAVGATAVPPVTVPVAVNGAQAIAELQAITRTTIPPVTVPIAVNGAQAASEIQALARTSVPPIPVPVSVNAVQAAETIAGLAATKLPPLAVDVTLTGADAALADLQRLTGIQGLTIPIDVPAFVSGLTAGVAEGVREAQAQLARTPLHVPPVEVPITAPVGPALAALRETVSTVDALTAANGRATASAYRLGQAQQAAVSRPRDASGRFTTTVEVVGAPALTAAATQATDLTAALQRTREATTALARAAAAPITLPTGPYVASLEALQGTIGATVRQVSDARQLLNQSLPPVTIPPIILPPITPPVPPDFSATIAETTRAAGIMRAEFLAAFPVQALGLEAKAGAALAVTELQTGLLSRVDAIGAQVAAGLLSPADAVQQIDVAIAAMAREIQAKQATLPELVLRTRGTGPRDTGVITEADLANVGQFDQTARQATVETERLEEATNRGRSAFEGHGRAALAARSSLTVLASQALGTSSTIGRLAESVLLFAGGSAAVIGTAGAVLVVAKAYEVLTGDARKAQEAVDAAVQAIRRSREQGGGPVEVANRELALLIEGEKRQRALLIAESGQSGAVPDALTKSWADRLQFAVAPALGLIRDTQGEVNKLTLDQVTAQQAVAQALTNQANAIADFQRQQQASRIGALAEAPSLGTDTGASARQRAIDEARLQGIIRSTTASLAERNEATRQFNQLVEGAQIPLERQRREALEIASAQASAYHDVARAFADAIAVVQQAIGALPRDQFSDLIAKQKAEARAGLPAIPAPSGLIGQQFDTATESVRKTQQALEDAITASNRFGAAAVRNANDARTAQQRLNDAIHDVTRGLDQVVGAAQNVGLIGEEAAGAIGSVLSLGDAIGSVIESASTANILGLIGAGIGAISSIGQAIFGPSEAELERNRVLAENNELLRRNNAELANQGGVSVLGGLGATLATLGPAITAAEAEMLRQARAAQAANQGLVNPIPGATGPQIDFGLVQDAINHVLEATGKTLQEFGDQVKAATGIDILDKKGRLVAAAFDQAKKAIDDMIEAATHFSSSIATQTSVLETQDKLTPGLAGRSTDEDVARLQRVRQIQLDNLRLSDAEEARVRSIDLSTKAGQEAFRKWEQTLLDRAKAGTLTAAELNAFGSVDELLPTINDAADGLNVLRDAAKDAAGRLNSFNLPPGFKDARFNFEASAPELPPTPPALPPSTITHFTPPLPAFATRGTDGAALPLPAAPSTTTVEVNVQTGAIVVHAAPGQSPQEIAQAVITELRSIGMAQFGDNLLLNGVN